MKKLILAAMKKLESAPVYTLSKDELRAYYEYRINNILKSKLAIVKNELDYLLSETGPGNLRIDPEFIPLITKKHSFTLKDSGYPNLENLLNKKIAVEKYISDNTNSHKTQELIFNLISHHLIHPSIISKEPFIISGVFNGVPVSCLIENGRWVLPDTKLFMFLQQCQKQKTFPIIIAKKISGILFPVFKNIFILGTNTYKIFLPEEGQLLVEEISAMTFHREPVPEMLGNFRTNGSPLDIKYCNQFNFISDTPPHGTDHTGATDQIHNFFTTILKSNILKYSGAFFSQKIVIGNNFLSTVSHFKKNNANKNLIKNYTLRDNLLATLNK